MSAIIIQQIPMTVKSTKESGWCLSFISAIEGQRVYKYTYIDVYL